MLFQGIILWRRRVTCRPLSLVLPGQSLRCRLSEYDRRRSRPAERNKTTLCLAPTMPILLSRCLSLQNCVLNISFLFLTHTHKHIHPHNPFVSHQRFFLFFLCIKTLYLHYLSRNRCLRVGSGPLSFALLQVGLVFGRITSGHFLLHCFQVAYFRAALQEGHSLLHCCQLEYFRATWLKSWTVKLGKYLGLVCTWYWGAGWLTVHVCH
jgi:hypothetical protein